MIKALRNPNPVKFVSLHNSSYIEAWNVKFCSWLLFICKRMLYTLRVRVDFLFIFFFIGKLRLCNSGSQFNVSFQEEYMFLSGLYMSQNHISESFFKFQNFPGRQATGPPPPPPPQRAYFKATHYACYTSITQFSCLLSLDYTSI